MAQLLNAPGSRTRHTRAEFRSLPEGPPYFELIDGEFLDMPRPDLVHADLARGLLRLLDPLEAEFGGYLTFEPNLYLPSTEDVLHPDLLYLTPANLAARRQDGVYGVPDLVVEILSPSTERKDRTVKRRIYERGGVPNLWLVDPRPPASIEAYELDCGGEYRLTKRAYGPETWRHRLFPGRDLDLRQLTSVSVAGIP